MNEFIEKLIGRLEEEKAKGIYDIDNVITVKDAYGKAIKIVNQLAEEYNPCNKLSCENCEVYDNGKHYCPKWCDVIKHTTEELANEYDNDWIQVSDKLPEVNGWYLVTNELGVVHQQYWCTSHWQKLRYDAVVAWRKLPEPYQPKGE